MQRTTFDFDVVAGPVPPRPVPKPEPVTAMAKPGAPPPAGDGPATPCMRPFRG